MRGISFRVRSRDDRILLTIFKGVAIEKLWWCISEDEIYNNKDESVFLDQCIDGETFLKTISEESYHVIFANIKAYVNPVKDSYIEDYDAFIKSECQLVLLCADVSYYEIFAKDSSVIEIIKNNAKADENNFYDVEFITDENDGRTRFSV